MSPMPAKSKIVHVSLMCPKPYTLDRSFMFFHDSYIVPAIFGTCGPNKCVHHQEGLGFRAKRAKFVPKSP